MEPTGDMGNRQPGTCLVCELGLISYQEAIELQRKLMCCRFEGKIGDTLLVLEHPPTVTLGRFGKPENVLLTPDELKNRGISIFNSDRGGDVTFHCPGQLVLYPIMDLRHRPGVLRGFLRDVEEVALRVPGNYGIAAERWSEHPGIWVDGKQIAAIGLRVSRGISMHGLSLNVNPDLTLFEVINLCGLSGKIATSMSQQLGRDISTFEVIQQVLQVFREVFNLDLKPVSREWLEGACLEPEAP